MTHGTLLINTNQVNGLVIDNGACSVAATARINNKSPTRFANQRKDAKGLRSSNLYDLME